MRLFVLFLCAISVVGASSSGTCAVVDSSKEDCGFMGITESQCYESGCCWVPAGTNSDEPWCYKQGSHQGYKLSNWSETQTGYEGSLSLVGDVNKAFGDDLSSLKLQVIFESEDIFRIKITDQTSTRWEIPQSVLSRPSISKKPSTQKYSFSYTESPFTFKVIRKADNVVVFNMDNTFVFKDQYIELTASIDSSAKTYGIGESARLNHALAPNSRSTLWASDTAAMDKYTNLYSSYPYYLQMVNGAAHGAMLMNSNGMDIVLGSSSLTFKTIGGIIDLYVFVGSTPTSVIQQYQSIVGTPTMMPYWSLGFHNCRYGYKSISQVEDVVSKFSAAGIPLDTQWVDIDYMQNYRDFTLDSVNFAPTEVAKFVDQLHDNGQHFVPIVDPGIMVNENDATYQNGMKEGVFIRDVTGEYYLGQVWPGPTYFPDFLNPKAQSFWTSSLKSFHDNLAQFDGIWIDMNEISNFCNSGLGQVCANTAASGCPAPGASQTDCCLECKTIDSSNKFDSPPYAILNNKGLLGTKTVAPSSYHYGNITLYNMHNLYGLTEQIATNKALKDIRGKRPFVLSRSSFMSTGKHSAKWTGDNASLWDDLKSSIISIMDFNIFGVPMIGADICGFLLDTTEELCARWIQVGAFYPFSRTHNALGSQDQELYLWDSVTEAAKNALGMRYQLLPYLYTLMYKASTVGETVARGLWINYPNDSKCLTTDSQFMLGSGILVSPVLDAGVTTVNAYFPQGLWYDYQTRSLAVDASSGGVTKVLSAPLTSINVHVAGGNILPLQESALTSTIGRTTPFTFFVALDANGEANGELFWDDGEEIDIARYFNSKYTAKVVESTGSFISSILKNTYTAASNNVVGTIVIVGKGITNPSSITLNGVVLQSSQVVYDASKSSITLSNLNIKLTDKILLTW